MKTRYKWTVEDYHQSQGYGQTQEITTGTIVPQSFPKIAIAVENLLLY